jgi:hypothetical protein
MRAMTCIAAPASIEKTRDALAVAMRVCSVRVAFQTAKLTRLSSPANPPPTGRRVWVGPCPKAIAGPAETGVLRAGSDTRGGLSDLLGT